MKYALVTGGSRGIGKAICTELAADGMYVLINYRSNKEEAENTLQEIKDQGGNGELLPFDVSDSDEIKSSLDNWHTSNPDQHISVLVNNAGINKDNLMVFMSEDQWGSVIKTNLDSFFHITSRLLTNMVINKWGRIINVVSLSGQKGMPGQTNYSAAKAGVIGATKSLAMEIGKKKITVNAVAPGFIRTDMTADLDEKELKKLIPLNRFGTAQEVAYAVSFLASDKAAYITGETISINGGMYS
ncbi:3-oxoacyl-ACP reductase FabG [Labilibaculum antarcticum]|uniref:3-oxoacyl-[acyl-carrier-protein] reductase n=1 Tax=Labilibaculum antarcticum TaxID=1717717 RepID=A0A1Y1CQ94_9BACT|nr:3-oxoacyl-ACP reductase FabG [Labilibaculum antarcticum]BAX82434.1 3-oxoacyl-[acyl-carrier-protein] reductase [Labilibaculum antarcticum]